MIRKLTVFLIFFTTLGLSAEVRYYSGGEDAISFRNEIPEQVSGILNLRFRCDYTYLLFKITHTSSRRSLKQVINTRKTDSHRIILSHGKGDYKITIYGSNSRRSSYSGLCYLHVENTSSKKFARMTTYSSGQAVNFKLFNNADTLPYRLRRSFRLRGRMDAPFLLVKTEKNGFFVKEVIRLPKHRFDIRIHLPFGRGRYTTTLFSSYRRKSKYKGLVKINFYNTDPEDRRFLAPSLTVDYNHFALKKLSSRIGEGLDRKKDIVKAAYRWVTRNIRYDVSKSLRGRASDIYRWRKAVCSGYASLLAALLRPHGIKVRIITGWGKRERHAWNQIYLNGRWINVDATWDAGYVNRGRFYRRKVWKYFEMDSGTFLRTHRQGKVTYR